MNTNPLERIEAIYSAQYDQYFGDVPGGADDHYLGVPDGTMAKLFAQIDDQGLWPDLFKLSERYNEYWVLCLFELLPHEPQYVAQRVEAMKRSLAYLPSSQASHAQETIDWCWADSNVHLLPAVIDMVHAIIGNIVQDEHAKSSVRYLRFVQSNLKQLLREHQSGMCLSDARREEMLELAHHIWAQSYLRDHPPARR